MSFKMPTEPAYVTDAGQPVYLIGGANVGNRHGRAPKFLVLHHTAGRDSREYLWQNKLGVSCHYLIGQYDDVGINPAIVKYASETKEYTFTQGFSSIGTYTDPNSVSISIEIEGPPIDDNVLDEAATLAASIVRYWAARDVHLLVVGHKHIDRNLKQDPQTSWTDLMRTIYSRVRL